jgi:hypothetical protein
MDKHPSHELPIRSKLDMLDDVVKIIHYLHEGDRVAADHLIDDLKTRAVYLDEKIQQDVLIFSEQVQFQYDYDPWHKVTPEVQSAADQLISDLGFYRPLK